MSHTKNINTIKIGNIKLPGGLAGPYIFSRICQYLDIIALLSSKGGKANCFDVNGRNVGRGDGDLND